MYVFQFPLTYCRHKKEQICYRRKRFRASKYTKNACAAAPDLLAGFGGWEGTEGKGRGSGG